MPRIVSMIAGDSRLYDLEWREERVTMKEQHLAVKALAC